MASPASVKASPSNHKWRQKFSRVPGPAARGFAGRPASATPAAGRGPAGGGMSERTCLIVLAAGEGTRMASRTPKVLHRIGGETLIGHVLAAAAAVNPARIAVVVGPGQAAVAAEARRLAPKAQIFVQKARRGTAHAVLAAQ